MPPDVSVVIPVNAQADTRAALRLVGDLLRYRGAQHFEIVLVINNYDPASPPDVIESLAACGLQVIAVPSAWREGEIVCFSARALGIRASAATHAIAFDADNRIPDPSSLLDWYAARFREGAKAAYTHTDYYDLRPLLSVRVKIFIHHRARQFKRVVLRIPTTRGGNYGVHRETFLSLYDRGLLADELNVGPTVKWSGGRIAYADQPGLRVLTSGRRFKGGWLKMLRYFPYRLAYNVRMLPVHSNSRRHPYHHHNIRTDQTTPTPK